MRKSIKYCFRKIDFFFSFSKNSVRFYIEQIKGGAGNYSQRQMQYVEREEKVWKLKVQIISVATVVNVSLVTTTTSTTPSTKVTIVVAAATALVEKVALGKMRCFQRWKVKVHNIAPLLERQITGTIKTTRVNKLHRFNNISPMTLLNHDLTLHCINYV